jgi:hypothetical protein
LCQLPFKVFGLKRWFNKSKRKILKRRVRMCLPAQCSLNYSFSQDRRELFIPPCTGGALTHKGASGSWHITQSLTSIWAICPTSLVPKKN